MHIRRYDFDYARRRFLEQTARGILATGVLMPAWRAMAQNGDANAAYPDELRSIEVYTKGRIKPGDVIDAGNVDAVRDLLDPIRITQITQMGRRLDVGAATTDLARLSPVPYMEATFSNRGKARFDATGNVVTGEGKPWIGGNPFPDPKTGLEVFANITLTWGRHDISFYPIHEWDVDANGEVIYRYQIVWAEAAPVARVTLDPKPYWPGHEDKLRYQSVFFASPSDSRGTGFLNVWPYDQTQFPDLWGYIPAFKRTRRFPTNQRFEPLIAGSTLYLSDAWTAGDPLLTWGNYNVVGRGPFLAALDGNWNPDDEDWHHPVHGGPKDQTFWNTRVELIPEVIIVEAEPTGYPRAPVSRKRVWFDARTLLPVAMVTFDRRGEAYKSFDGAYSLYDHGGRQVMDGKYPYWSWCTVHAHDVQTNRVTRLEQTRKVDGGHVMKVNDPDVYDRYLTMASLQRFGG